MAEEKSEKWKHVAKEIVATERKYADSLDAAVQFYLRPLLADPSLAALSEEQVRRIFVNMEDLHSLHQRFADRVSGLADDLDALCAAFLEMAPRCQPLYVTYINGYTDSAALLDKKVKHSSKLEKWLQQQKKASSLGGLDLPSLLIMPVQRIPRYILLFRELGKHRDEAQVKAVHVEFQEVADFINEAKRDAENMQRVLKLQQRITGWPMDSLAEIGRSLHGQGEVDIDKGSVRYFLFNDLILFVKREGEPLVYVGHELFDASVNTELQHTTLLLVWNNRRVSLVFRDPDTAAATARVVEQCVQSAKHGGITYDISDALKPAVFEGYVQRQGSHSMKRQYVQLRGSTLFWSESKEDIKPLGWVNLQGRVIMDAEHILRLPNCVVLSRSGQKDYFLHEEQRSVLTQWLEAIYHNCGGVEIATPVQQKYLQHNEQQLLVEAELILRGVQAPKEHQLLLAVEQRVARGGRVQWVVRSAADLMDGPGKVRLLESFSIHQCGQRSRLSLYAVSSSRVLQACAGDTTGLKLMGCAPYSVMDLARRKQVSVELDAKSATGISVALKLSDEAINNSKLKLKIEGSKLAAKQKLKRTSDPFLAFLRMAGTNRWEEVYRSDYHKNDLNPTFDVAAISVQLLCGGDDDRPFKIQCLSWRRDRPHDMIGEVRLGKKKLLQSPESNLTFDLVHPKYSKPQGTLRVVSHQMTNEFSVFEYLRGGMKLKPIVAVDFSHMGNGPFSSPTSLHHPGNDKEPGSYSNLLYLISEMFQDISPGAFHAYGVGAEHSDCFELGGTDGQPLVESSGALLTGYENARQFVEYGKRLNVVPVVKQAIEIARKSAGGATQEFYCLVAFISEDPSDLREAIGMLLEATDAPLFVAFIGLGTNPFALNWSQLAKETSAQSKVQRLIASTTAAKDYVHSQQVLRKAFRELSGAIEEWAAFKKIHPPRFSSMHINDSAPKRSTNSFKPVDWSSKKTAPRTTVTRQRVVKSPRGTGGAAAAAAPYGRPVSTPAPTRYPASGNVAPASSGATGYGRPASVGAPSAARAEYGRPSAASKTHKAPAGYGLLAAATGKEKQNHNPYSQPAALPQRSGGNYVPLNQAAGRKADVSVTRKVATPPSTYGATPATSGLPPATSGSTFSMQPATPAPYKNSSSGTLPAADQRLSQGAANYQGQDSRLTQGSGSAAGYTAGAYDSRLTQGAPQADSGYVAGAYDTRLAQGAPGSNDAAGVYDSRLSGYGAAGSQTSYPSQGYPAPYNAGPPQPGGYYGAPAGAYPPQNAPYGAPNSYSGNYYPAPGSNQGSVQEGYAPEWEAPDSRLSSNWDNQYY